MSSNPDQYRADTDVYRPADNPHRRRPQRLMVFSAIFVPLLLATQIYVFSQPAIYVSEASVLTTAAADVDQATPVEADLQHVSIQKELLLGQPILEKTTQQLLPHPDNSPWTIDELRSMFAVKPVADTNLLKLTAEGPEPILLRRTLNAWLEAYRETRAEYVAEISEKATSSLVAELARIDKQVTGKRREIDQFRQQHDILSVESTDNQAHARLQGLNQSLNKALEDEVKAKAKMDAIHRAIAQGKTVVPESDSRSLAVMIEQAGKLREKLAELRGQYTDDYIRFNPAFRDIPAQLADLEEKINAKSQSGGSLIVQEADNDYEAAHQAVASIQQQLAEHKQRAADYTSQFAKHQALQQELLKLETLQQDTKQRLVDIEVKQRQKYPQAEVIDSASLPSKPVRPDYWLESAAGFAVSLALGLLAVWINDYLRRETPIPTLEAVAGERLRHDPRQTLGAFSAPPPLTGYASKALENDAVPRELSHGEMAAMYEAADPQTREIISLLLNGLSVLEIMSLTADCFDLQKQLIAIPMSGRTVAMTQCTLDVLDSGWQTITCGIEEVDALLSCAAIDGGLVAAKQIRAEVVSYTYALFLVRQGIKLTDLPRIIGPVNPSRLLLLGKFSPEGAGLPLEQIDRNFLKTFD